MRAGYRCAAMQPFGIDRATVDMSDRRLARHLATVVLVKLSALAVIWWFFERGNGADMNVDANLQVPSAAAASQRP
jgi:hypothetical protein